MSPEDSIYERTDVGQNIEIEFKKLGFHTQKLSWMNSVSMYGKRVHWTRFLCMENKFIELVFPYMENEFIQLVFHELNSRGLLDQIIVFIRLLSWSWVCLIRSLSWSDVFISSYGFAWRCLVQKIVGCVCRRSCNFLWWKNQFKELISIHGKWVH